MAPPGPVTTAPVRPDLPSQTMSSTTCTCQACGGGGIIAPSPVEIPCVSKQYRVSGQLGFGFLTTDCDGEHDGVLPNTSVSSGPFWPPGGVRVGPSVWILAPDFWSSKLLDLWTLTQKQWPWIETLVSLFSSSTRAHARKLRNNWAYISHIWSTVSQRSVWLPPMTPLQMWGPL